MTDAVETACHVLRMIGDSIVLHWARAVCCSWDDKADEDVSNLNRFDIDAGV
jgi:hypothetical protein